MKEDGDTAVRLRAFEWLTEQTAFHGDVLPWGLLQSGCGVLDERVPLVSMEGIFTSRLCRFPLTIGTAVGGPYGESFGVNGLILCKYRGTDAFHRDNDRLRRAMLEQVPAITAARWPGSPKYARM